MILVDVGVWLAAAWGRHVHHEPAAHWFDAQTEDLILCRVTQTGLLRLMSNPSVMGDDVVTRAQAWQHVDAIAADKRVIWADEPAALDTVFRAFSAQPDGSHKLWTDDYLAAFAHSAGAGLATLDRKLAARYPSVRVHTVRL